MRSALMSMGSIVLVLLFCLLPGCCDDCEEPTCPDTSRPVAVGDLSATTTKDSTVMLTWTAPGDDGDEGDAAEYDIRQAVNPSTTADWWDASVAVANIPIPRTAGAVETLMVEHLFPDSTYWFALKAADEVPNWSLLSNVAAAKAKIDEKPVACFEVSPNPGPMNTEFAFDASCSSDREDSLKDLLYQWDWEGDGIFDMEIEGDPTATHVFDDPGAFNVVLRVTDTDGGKDADTLEVVQRLHACFEVSPNPGPMDTEFVFDASCTSDREDLLQELLYLWDWNADGIFDVGIDGDPTATHSFAAPGTYSVVLRITDSRGWSDSDTLEVVQRRFYARTTPQNLLINLKLAYDERNVSEYDSLLPPDFKFILAPDDQHLGEEFDRQDEISLHTNMFEADMVQELELDFQLGSLTLDEDRTTESDSLWTITITNVDLYLFGVTPQMPDTPQGYEMQDGMERFWFRKSGWSYLDGNPIWKIAEWEELYFPTNSLARLRGPLPVEYDTWGSIKGMFR
ncbi:PKD domain-containing protein [Candidatus Eisenbacteria bacterium]|uniref:PKD domain-containing protein n=1 Tax=Eiseniibacteriota bacterium TaxID=2212470 RepID=A0ABV6YKF5_UNCEI